MIEQDNPKVKYRAKKILIATSVLIFLTYLIYGAFFLNLPNANPDKHWQIARTNQLIQFHQTDDPLISKEVSPFLSVLFNATPYNKYLGIIKFGAYAASSSFLPINQAIYFTSFLASLLLCFMVYLLAREFYLSRFVSFLSVIIMVAAPEFFLQVHSPRVEIAFPLFYVFFIILLLRTLKIVSVTKQCICLIFIGLISWIPAIALHPTAIFIPPGLGIIYFVLKRKNIFSINTLLFGISFVPGFLLFLHIYLSVASVALESAGGNYLEAQGPPVLKEAFYIFILKLPLLFYNKFESFNLLSKPLSFMVFFAALAGAFIIYRKKKSLIQVYPVIIPAVITAMVICHFLSGSYGPYNIIIFPFVGIIIAFLINDFIIYKYTIKAPLIISVAMIFIFISNFYGLKAQMLYNSEYEKVRLQIQKIIPANSAILGSPLYYTLFKNQPFYHIVWFEPASGIPGQSFNEAVEALKIQYMIVDEIFLAKASAARRSSGWKDSMMLYLHKDCTLLNTIKTNYYVGPWAGNPKLFPEKWRYDGMKKGFVRRIQIYKVNAHT